MSWFSNEPWLQTAGRDETRPIPHATPWQLWQRAVDEHGDDIAIDYYGYRPTYREVDKQISAFAAYLQAQGFQAGDRLGVYLQNVPQYQVAVFATWKLGGLVVPLNPMYRDELDHIFADSGISALVVSAAAWVDRVAAHASAISTVITVNDRDLAAEAPAAIFGPFPEQVETGQADFGTIIDDTLTELASVADPTSGFGPAPHPTTEDAESAVFIGYTSGTSGKSKGALLRAQGLAFNAQMLKARWDYTSADSLYQMAPMFHITGFVCIFLTSVANGATLVLNYRFDPGVALQQFRSTQPAYMAGPATAYLALMAHPDFQRTDFDSFKNLMSGGAPLPEGVVKNFEARTGRYIGQGYGLTETSAQAIVVPAHLRAPVDPESGNLSCGLPQAGIMVRILNDDGAECQPGEVGEICISGPIVAVEYLGNPEATARDIADGQLRTGDVGFMNEDGWVFIVDRKKDMINASGFKVWPREVEDVLYTHAAVQEAAVVGVPDEYRGESVVAFVTLKPGAEASEGDIVDHCREHLASYKAPREVNIITDMPKTASGKILRREMRVQAAQR